jgi:hypothetical protein
MTATITARKPFCNSYGFTTVIRDVNNASPIGPTGLQRVGQAGAWHLLDGPVHSIARKDCVPDWGLRAPDMQEYLIIAALGRGLTV